MANNSEKLEREAGRTRAQLAETLDALRARMTPGQVIDQLIDYAREGPGAGFGRNLAREVRENPLPLVLTHRQGGRVLARLGLYVVQ
jgi:hypothetical protein